MMDVIQILFIQKCYVYCFLKYSRFIQKFLQEAISALMKYN